MATLKALQITKPHELKMVTLERPEPGPGEVLIKVMASGICGTDIHILEGEYVGAYPVIPGHEFSGVVEQAGQAVSRIKVGDKVAVEPNIACDNCSYCLNNQQNFCENWQGVGVTLPGGMAEYVIAPEKAVFDIGELEFEEGAFVEPLSCVLHGIQKTCIRLADRVVILGAGPIGILLLQAVNVQGAQSVTVVELDQARAEAAQTVGADQIYRSLDGLPKDAFEVVIDATGVIPVMKRTPEFTREGGKILLFGVPPKTNIEFDAFTLFLKGLTILTSYTSVRNSLQAIDLLKNKRINVKPLISHRLPLAKFEHGVNLIKNKQENVKKVLITPNG
jgi:2-desacetyl-2-hydroxyethyl bacteriochlorophyllide A dehydrogenase